MSISSIDSSYSLMGSYSFLPVQQVRSVGADDVPFTMAEQIENEQSIDNKSSSSSLASKNLNNELSNPFFRTSQTSNDTTGIEISPEMQEFLAHMPESQKTNVVGNSSLEGNYKANVEKANLHAAKASPQVAPLLNNAGLLMSQNPTQILENQSNTLQAAQENYNYTPPAVEPSAVQSIQSTGTNANFSQGQYLNSSSFSTNSLLNSGFAEKSVTSGTNVSQRRINQAMQAYMNV